MSVFISHAEADKVLVEPFVDLLQTGVNIPQERIFCTSLEGMGIPRGQNFIEFIRQKLTAADFVIMIITPKYYESAFCLCELRAIWATSQTIFPILVPPLDYDYLKAVLTGVQSGYINDKRALNELRDRLLAAGIGSGATGRWESKRDAFFKGFSKLQAKIAGPSLVPLAEHEKLKEAYEGAQEEIEENTAKIEELERIIGELKACKDKADVSKVMKKYTDENDQFESLASQFKASVSGLPHVVREALYFHSKDGEWNPRSSFGNEGQWEDIRSAADRGLLRMDGNTVYPNTDNPKIHRAIERFAELERFAPESARTFTTLLCMTTITNST